MRVRSSATWSRCSWARSASRRAYFLDLGKVVLDAFVGSGQLQATLVPRH